MKNILFYTIVSFILLGGSISYADEDTPVQNYIENSNSFQSGIDIGMLTQPLKLNQSYSAGTSLGWRTVSHNLLFGLSAGIGISNSFKASDKNIDMLYPKLSVGYVLPLNDKFAITPFLGTAYYAHIFGNSSNPDTTPQANAWSMTANLAIEHMFAKHWYVEPLVSFGNFSPMVGKSSILLGAGYNLGFIL